jgi:hypothetical protein
MKDHARQSFRWAAHTLGAANVKPRDYEPGPEIEAASPYSAWAERKDRDDALEVGDLLETDSGALFIYKYVGFEEARWVLPEPKTPDAGPSAPPPVAMRVQ